RGVVQGHLRTCSITARYDERRSVTELQGEQSRMRRLALSISALTASMLAAAAAAQPGPARVMLPEEGAPLELEAAGTRVRVVLVASGLVGPWDLEILPDGETMLITQQNGQLRMLRDGQLLPQPVWEAPPPGG